MIVYELLTLQLPYSSFSITEMSTMIERGALPPLPPSPESFLSSEIMEKCSILVSLFEKCAVLEPDRRMKASLILECLQ